MSHGAVLPSFGRYQAIEVVRQDGATTHHTAFDPELGHPVALITTPAGPDRAEENRLAFRLPRMRHPNIVSVLHAGLEGDVTFVAAECLQTEPLSVFVARAGRMPFFQGLPLVLQLLSAIEHAQARRMVHASIELEHLQVTRGGQLKLPAAGWSLSADRQPNLEAAARIARAVLSGSCPPALRGALDEVLLRAEAPDREARYQHADEFILALLAAAGYPVRGSGAAMELRVPAEPQRVEPVLLSEPIEPVLLAEPLEPLPDANVIAPRPVRHAQHKPVRRHRAGRNLLAACLAAALLVPALVGERVFTGGKDAPTPAGTMALGAPPAAVAPAALAEAALAPAPVVPARVTPAPIAPAAAAPAAVELASMAPSPVPRSPVREPQVQGSPDPTPELEASPLPASPVPPSPAAPVPAARSPAHPVAVAPRSIAPKPVARTATRQQAAHAQPAPPAHQARPTRPATAYAHAHAARPQRARVLTAASGCPYDLPIFRELCEARECSRPELRQTPACARMLAEQRAALARLRGTPD
jgi:hypothetical protein